MSRKATASSVSRTFAAGISPRTILQKMQLAVVRRSVRRHGGAAPVAGLLISELRRRSAGRPRLRRRDHVTPEATTAGLVGALTSSVLAQQRDHGHRGGVALADLGQLVDPGVAAGPALEPRADLVEELEGHVLLGHDGQDAAEVVQVPAVLGQRDQLLGERLDFLGLGQGRLDLAVLQQRGGQVAEEHPAMRRGPLELTAGISVTHGRFNLIIGTRTGPG